MNIKPKIFYTPVHGGKFHRASDTVSGIALCSAVELELFAETIQVLASDTRAPHAIVCKRCLSRD